MNKLTDREKVQFLRKYVQMGHTDGKPFESATFRLDSYRPYSFYSMKEVLGLVEHLNKAAILGCMSPSDDFVYHLLYENKVLEAFFDLAKYENTGILPEWQTEGD